MKNYRPLHRRPLHYRRQQGAILIVALVFLLLTAIITTTIMQTSILETRMANNEQFREEAFQQVQAVTNAIAADSNNLVVTGSVGYKVCAVGVSGCDAATISLPSTVTTVPSGATLNYTAVRLAPLFAPLPFRISEANAGSAAAYKGALFEVNASFDGIAAGLGQAQIAQGIAMRVAVGAQ